MAFETRLAMVCRMRSGSPQTWTSLESHGEADVGFEGGGLLEAGGSLHEGVCRAHHGVELGVAARDALDIEDVVDELDEAVGVADGDLEHVLHFLRARGERSAGDEAERGAEAGERGAELVRDGGDELVLHAVERAALGSVGEGDDDADGLAGVAAVVGVG